MPHPYRAIVRFSACVMDQSLSTFVTRFSARLADRALPVARSQAQNAAGEIAEVWREIADRIAAEINRDSST